MIWHDGELIPDDSLRVGVHDRVFEHGLGLFETFRSWGRRAPLLGRHLERLRASARELGIGLEGVRLPDGRGVSALLSSVPTPHPDPPPQGGRGSNFGDSDLHPPPLRGRARWAVGTDAGEMMSTPGDALLRLTLTAGSDMSRPVAWMVARPLPLPEQVPLRVQTLAVHVDPSVHSHKMLNYWGRRRAFDRARELDADESLLVSPEGRIWEGSRNNVLFVPSGRPRTIATPSLHGPVLPGIMRRVALEFAASRGFAIEERGVELRELLDAEAVFLTNSVRGVRPVGSIDGRAIRTEGIEAARLLGEELPGHILSLSEPDS